MLLNIIGRILKSERGAYAVILTLFTQAVLVGLNFATGVITARVLGPEGRGIFSSAVIWPQFLTSLAGTGIPIAIVYFIRNETGNRAQVVTSCILICCVMAAFSTTAALLIIPYAMRGMPYEVIAFAEFCGIWTGCSFLSNCVRQLMVADQRFRLLNTYSFVPPTMFLVGLLFTIGVTGHLTVWQTILCLTLPGPVVLIMMIYSVKGELNFQLNGVRPYVQRILLYTVQVAPLDLIVGVAASLDRLFLVHSVSAEDLGVYVVLFNLSRLIAVLAAVINIVVFPKMAGRPIEEMRSLHDHVVRIVFYVIVGLTVLTVIFGSKFVAMVYGPGYNMSGNLLVILVLECGVSCMCQVSTQFYLAAGKPIPASVIQALSLAVVYCALSVLVGTAGIIGAAWALLIAGTAKLLMLLVGIRFYYDSLPRLYPKISDIVYIRDLLR